MTFIVAEIGINHNGSVDIARKLIDAAKWAGADAVKFQKRTVDVVYAGQLETPRESPWGSTTGDQKRGLEFGEAQYDAIALHCEQIKMPWFASAWDIPALEFLRKYDCPYNKIASAMVTNTTFVRLVGEEKKPTFLSTAMCSSDDISRAIVKLTSVGCMEITLMHCVGTYPCPEIDINLKMIQTLARSWGFKVGYSGHEASISPSVMAVVMGAVAIERHITLEKSMYGSDQAASLEPIQFWNLVNQIRKVSVVLGDGIKRTTEAEKAVARKLRYWEA